MQNKKCKYDLVGFADDLGVGLEEISQLFAQYIEEMQGEIAEMLNYLSKSDWYMLERIVHNIKGVSANLNVNDVYTEAAAFDEKLKVGITDDAGSSVQKIISLLKEAEIELREAFKEAGFPLG